MWALSDIFPLLVLSIKRLRRTATININSIKIKLNVKIYDYIKIKALSRCRFQKWTSESHLFWLKLNFEYETQFWKIQLSQAVFSLNAEWVHDITNFAEASARALHGIITSHTAHMSDEDVIIQLSLGWQPKWFRHTAIRISDSSCKILLLIPNWTKQI